MNTKTTILRTSRQNARVRTLFCVREYIHSTEQQHKQVRTSFGVSVTCSPMDSETKVWGKRHRLSHSQYCAGLIELNRRE